MHKEYIQQKGYKIIGFWECNWWELYRTDVTVKKTSSSKFPLSATSQRRTAHATDYESKAVWLRSMRPRSF